MLLSDDLQTRVTRAKNFSRPLVDLDAPAEKENSVPLPGRPFTNRRHQLRAGDLTHPAQSKKTRRQDDADSVRDQKAGPA